MQMSEAIPNTISLCSRYLKTQPNMLQNCHIQYLIANFEIAVALVYEKKCSNLDHHFSILSGLPVSSFQMVFCTEGRVQ